MTSRITSISNSQCHFQVLHDQDSTRLDPIEVYYQDFCIDFKAGIERFGTMSRNFREDAPKVKRQYLQSCTASSSSLQNHGLLLTCTEEIRTLFAEKIVQSVLNSAERCFCQPGPTTYGSARTTLSWSWSSHTPTRVCKAARPPSQAAQQSDALEASKECMNIISNS